MRPLDQGNLSARVYTALRDALIGGNFGPGHRIIIQDLADELGTSVTPVREACLRLTSERGLEVRSGRFFVVPELTLARYLEIRQIRTLLEGLAAELATRHATPDDIEELTAIQKKFEAARHSNDAAASIRLNKDFHFGVYRLSRTDILLSHIENLWVCMGPILKVYHEDIKTDYIEAAGHVHLIEALKARDSGRVREAIEHDIERGGESILRYLSERAESA